VAQRRERFHANVRGCVGTVIEHVLRVSLDRDRMRDPRGKCRDRAGADGPRQFEGRTAAALGFGGANNYLIDLG
jgi:hypothetical protein